MPASTKDSGGQSPVDTPSVTGSGPPTPLLGRTSSRPSTRRSTPVSTPGAGPSTTSRILLHPPDPHHRSNGDALQDNVVPQPPHGTPSYKEYDEKVIPQGVLHGMHVLGDLPPAQLIAKTKAAYPWAPANKNPEVVKKRGKYKTSSNGNGNGLGTAATTTAAPSPAGPNFTTPTPTTYNPATPSLSSDRASARASGSPTSSVQAFPQATPPKPINPWINGSTPSSKTPLGRQRLSMVVEAAIQRSKITGSPEMGIAIRKLYDESLTDDSLAELLDAILAQTATAQQFSHFQAYVRAARADPGNQSEKPFVAMTAEDVAREEEKLRQNERDHASKVGVNGNGVVSPPPEKKRKLENAVAQSSEKSAVSTSQPVIKADSPLPSNEEMQKLSDIRDPPAPHLPTRTRGKKRPRSPSPSSKKSSKQSSPVLAPPAVQLATVPAAPAHVTPAPPPPPPTKKKNKVVKAKALPAKKAVVLENTVVTAGIGEAPDHRRARHGSEEVSENEDVCAVCNGAGNFLCCERCPRSFHFTCLNPPLEDTPEGVWFCNKCQAQTNPPPREPKGLFSELIDNINRQNPASFRLPSPIRNYFTGVETGSHGEYVDNRDTKTMKFGKNGFPEEHDTYKLRDKNGALLVCHDCNTTALGGRQIISCDYCPLSWHLDCVLPVPMAAPPTGKRKWMCPAHIDSVLKARRPKNAIVVDTVLRRGNKNNGVIEIDNESDHEGDFEEIIANGIVYRLPERGIKLDFMAAVHRMREEEQEKSRKRVSEVPISEEPPKRVRLSVDSLLGLSAEEENVVSALWELRYLSATAAPEAAAPATVAPATAAGETPAQVAAAPTDVSVLLERLISQASDQVKSVLSTPSAPTSLEQEFQQLTEMKRLIDARLQSIAQPEVNGGRKLVELTQDHHMDDHEFNELMDADMDGAFALDEEETARSTNSAPVAPMAPMMAAPVHVAPVAPIAPMAFMKPGGNA